MNESHDTTNLPAATPAGIPHSPSSTYTVSNAGSLTEPSFRISEDRCGQEQDNRRAGCSCSRQHRYEDDSRQIFGNRPLVGQRYSATVLDSEFEEPTIDDPNIDIDVHTNTIPLIRDALQKAIKILDDNVPQDNIAIDGATRINASGSSFADAGRDLYNINVTLCPHGERRLNLVTSETPNIPEARPEPNGIWPLLDYAVNFINGVKEFVAGRISAAAAQFER